MYHNFHGQVAWQPSCPHLASLAAAVSLNLFDLRLRCGEIGLRFSLVEQVKLLAAVQLAFFAGRAESFTPGYFKLFQQPLVLLTKLLNFSLQLGNFRVVFYMTIILEKWVKVNDINGLRHLVHRCLYCG